MCSVIWLAWAVTDPTSGGTLPLEQYTILTYQSEAGHQERQFVLRLARFGPDIVLEWESYSHQGTIHLYEEAVSEAERFAVAGLFEPGVEIESDDTMTKWFPRGVFRELQRGEGVKVRLNSNSAKFEPVGRESRRIYLDGEEVEVPVLRVRDNRKGEWAILNDADNPLVVEYTTPYYRERLTRVARGSEKSMRWLRQLPPIK